MPPLPPYATDEPDSFYESPQHPQRRQRLLTPTDQKKDRSSTYDVYDDYLSAPVDPTTNRQSGVGGIGLGFLNGSMDDDDSDDDDDDTKVSMPAPKYTGAEPLPSKSKHDQLLAATRKQTPSPPPQYIASPKPGYAAPIAALNLAKPQPTAAPGSRPNPNLHITVHQQPMFSSPSPSLPGTPHPLQAPLSPITPAFARPRGGDVTFAEKKPIMRGNNEETLLPKRGEAGDDFWRRFSMIAKEDRRSPKQSSWLAKTRSGSRRLAAWVWIVGLVLLLCAGGGIGIGWYLSHKAPDHQQPTSFGGSGKEAAASSSSSSSIRTISKTVSVRTSLHVSPTNTVARRAPEPQVTAVPLSLRKARRLVPPAYF